MIGGHKMKTEDFPKWFYNINGDKNFENHIGYLRHQKCDILQIGAYTGDASLWLCENVLFDKNSTLTDVDTWSGSPEKVYEDLNFDWSTVENEYNNKIEKYFLEGKIIKKKMTSSEFFKDNKNTYDFIYVDGDHRALTVFDDAVKSFFAVKVGGVIGFDDYLWDEPKAFLSPKAAIDSFLLIFADYVEVIHSGYQLWVRKHTEINQEHLK